MLAACCLQLISCCKNEIIDGVSGELQICEFEEIGVLHLDSENPTEHTFFWFKGSSEETEVKGPLGSSVVSKLVVISVKLGSSSIPASYSYKIIIIQIEKSALKITENRFYCTKSQINHKMKFQ